MGVEIVKHLKSIRSREGGDFMALEAEFGPKLVYCQSLFACFFGGLEVSTFSR